MLMYSEHGKWPKGRGVIGPCLLLLANLKERLCIILGCTTSEQWLGLTESTPEKGLWL